MAENCGVMALSADKFGNDSMIRTPLEGPHLNLNFSKIKGTSFARLKVTGAHKKRVVLCLNDFLNFWCI